MWFPVHNRSSENVIDFNIALSVYIIGLVLLTWVPLSRKIVWKSICARAFSSALGEDPALIWKYRSPTFPSYSDPGEGGSSGGENGGELETADGTEAVADSRLRDSGRK